MTKKAIQQQVRMYLCLFNVFADDQYPTMGIVYGVERPKTGDVLILKNEMGKEFVIQNSKTLYEADPTVKGFLEIQDFIVDSRTDLDDDGIYAYRLAVARGNKPDFGSLMAKAVMHSRQGHVIDRLVFDHRNDIEKFLTLFLGEDEDYGTDDDEVYG